METCWSPLVPLTVIGKLWNDPANPPLQPVSSKAPPANIAISGSIRPDLAIRFRGPAIMHKPPARLTGTNGNCHCPAGKAAVWAAVCMVSTVVAPDAPGVTMGGVKVAVAPAGKPEADIVTTLSKGPPMGGTVMLISTEPPAFTVNDDAGAVTEKVEADVTVTSSPIEVEVAKPALPEYTAVTISVPEGRLESVKLATPDPFRVAVPSSVLPLKKLTVPAGVPAGAGGARTEGARRGQEYQDGENRNRTGWIEVA